LDCTSYINLPFAKNACTMLDSNRPFGLDFTQAASGIFN